MMNKQAVFAGILTLGLLLMATAEERTRTFTGEIADSQCSMNVHSLTRSHTEMMKNKNMGGTATNCTNYCVKYLGGDLVLANGDSVYRLDDQERPASFTGLKVKITGTLNSKTKTIHVVDIKAAD
jgi:hypothetical protein